MNTVYTLSTFYPLEESKFLEIFLMAVILQYAAHGGTAAHP